MNGDEQIEVHYMDNGYSYPVSEGYVDFFGGAPAAPLNYLNFAPMLDQVNLYVASLIATRNFCVVDYMRYILLSLFTILRNCSR